MEPLRVQTQLKSRYTVLDASGRLPFDIVFGLRRRSDSDSRDISFQTTRSFLDVPYALANGLLRLHELRHSDKGPDEHVDVDLGRLRNGIVDDEHVDVDLGRLRNGIVDDEPALEHITFPSKSNRTEKRGQMGVTEYRYRIDPGSLLASLFEPGRKYSIGIASRDLGIHYWIGSDHAPSSNKTNIDTSPSSIAESAIETCKLVSNPHGGFAVFTVVERLIWPPKVETRIHLLGTHGDGCPSRDNLGNPLLQVTVTNTGSDLISIQTRGQQRFLSPWGPFQPESDDGLNAGRKPCILDPSSTTGNLQVVDIATGSVVQDSKKPGVCGLTCGRPDLRPKVDELIVLKPGLALSRMVDLDALVRKLDNGRYLISLKPKGCWWHLGEIQSGPGDDGKVPKRFRIGNQTPVVLESDDEVKIVVRDGKIVGAE
ncbi:hypothetical protein Q7P37_009100 [Cladosporium fusiforme]